MPLPVAHSLAGFTILQGQRLVFFQKLWQNVLLFVVLANLADADFIPGFFVGNPNAFHQLHSHSLGAAVLVGVLGAWYFGRKNQKYAAYFVVIALAYFSHVLLDYFNHDMRAPYGVMMWWPFSGEHFTAPQPIFFAVHKSSASGTFLQSLWHIRNWQALLRELLVMGPVALIAWWTKRNRKKAISH